MEKFRPENGTDNFKLQPENNNKGDLSEQEIKQAKLYIAERKHDEPNNNDPLTENDIKELSSRCSDDEKETDNFADFVVEKFKKPISRRNFIKLAAGTAVGLTVGYKYFEENIDKLWNEYKEKMENNYEIAYSKEMTILYEELEKYPQTELNYENVKKNLNGINGEFRHAEFIKKSEKKEIDDLAESIIANNNEVILFGEYHGLDSNALNSVKILERLKEKGTKKIAKIGLEFLDFKNPKDIEAIKKFNNKQISVEDFFNGSYFRSNIKPLLEFARKNDIPIDGLEDENNFGYGTGLERLTNMSHRVGDMVKEKADNEIVVIYSGAAHSTKSGWEEEKAHDYISFLQNVDYPAKETAKDALEKDYTFKEYLEKLGFSPAVIKLEDIGYLAQINNNLIGYTYNFLKEEDIKGISTEWREKWENYKTGRIKPFSISPNDEKNLYFIINPSEIPETPPALNVFEQIRKNFQLLHKMILKKDYVSFDPYKYEMGLGSQTGAGLSAKMAEIDLKTGKPKKLFLPEQLKK